MGSVTSGGSSHTVPGQELYAVNPWICIVWGRESYGTFLIRYAVHGPSTNTIRIRRFCDNWYSAGQSYRVRSGT